MMKEAIIGRVHALKYALLHRGDSRSEELADMFHALARKRRLGQDDENPQIVVSIGGDGTMLHAFHKYIDRLDKLAFVGVHTGHLGFYADWKASELHQLINLMSEETMRLEDKLVMYPLLEGQLHRVSISSTMYALNELTVRGSGVTLVAQLHINDNLFETFRGDGICISTPSGSTAYNKSLQGAIIHPSLEALQIAEMASINNRVYRTLGSPIILPKHHYCDLYPQSHRQILLSLDHLHLICDDIISIRCRVADRKVRFARFRPFPFWNRVKEAFIGTEAE